MSQRKVRPIRIDGDIAYVPLTKGYEATIDASQAHLVAPYNWCAQVARNTVYAVRSYSVGGKKQKVMMHRVLAGASDGLEVDHINMCGLDNRLENLRCASKKENARNRPKQSNNTSGFKGVAWDASRKKFQVQIMGEGERIYIGRYDSASDAARAYSDAVKQYHGCFGRTE